jgi:predicted phosphodiesterase
MRFALLSCIHGNLPALEAVLRDAKAMRCETTLCLGDIVGTSGHPKECLDLVRSHCQASVKGNFDDYCSPTHELSGFNPKAAERFEWMREQLSPSDHAWLSTLPYTLDVSGFTIVHASLDEPQKWAYIFDKLAAASHFKLQSLPLCFNGHTHVPVAFLFREDKARGGSYTKFAIEPGTKYLVNVGSVGQPRDNQPGAAYVIYDADKKSVELRRVDYPRPPSDDSGIAKPVPGGGPPGTLTAHNDFPRD